MSRNVRKDYRIEVHSGAQGLNDLFDDWVDLVSRLDYATPSHLPDWYRAFLRRPDVEGTRVEFIAIYDGAALAAVFPVGIKRFRRFDLVELSIPINIEANSTPDIVVGPTEDHAEVFRFFLRNSRAVGGLTWDVLVVGKTLADSNIAKCIESARRFTTTRRQVGYCCYFDFQGLSASGLRLSKRVRSRLRNATNRLEAAGTSQFEIVTETDSVMSVYSVFADLEMSGWKAHGRHGKDDYNAGSAVLLNPSKHGFYRDLVQSFSERGCVEMFVLKLNGQPIAIMISAVLYGRCYLMRTAYDAAHAHLSPGTLLFQFALQRHAQDPDTSSIVLFSDFKWLDAWKPLRQEYVSYVCFSGTVAGTIYGFAMRLRAYVVRAFNVVRGVG
jgi:hypothetical protein